MLEVGFVYVCVGIRSCGFDDRLDFVGDVVLFGNYVCEGSFEVLR